MRTSRWTTICPRAEAALDVISEITGAETVDIVGLCLGGALTAIAAGVPGAGGDDRVGTLTLLNTMLDYAEPGVLGMFTDERPWSGSSARWPRPATSRAPRWRGTFDVLRANDLIFNYVVSNWLMGQDPPAFDILAWNADSTRMPAAMHAFYLRALLRRATSSPGARSELAGAPARARRGQADTYMSARSRTTSSRGPRPTSHRLLSGA